MDENRLGELSALCAQMQAAERSIEEADATLKSRKATLRAIATEDIPALMTELGVQEITLDSGEKIKVALEVFAAIPKAVHDEAMVWLEENGFGGLIKTTVEISFGRSEQSRALEVYEDLLEKGLDVATSAGVHASTLKAFAKERLEANATLPEQLFGIQAVNTAKLIKARASRKKGA